MFSIGKLRIHSSFFIYMLLAAALGDIGQFLAVVAAVTAHELAHAATASVFKLKVETVVVTPIGEVAHISGFDGISATKKYAILLAGPAVNFAAAFLLHAFCSGIELAATLTQINLALGLFNLLPVYPMDGGRLLFVFLGNRLGILNSARHIRLLAKAGAAFLTAAGIVQLVLFPLNVSLLAVGVFFAAIYKRERASMIFSYYNGMLQKNCERGRRASVAVFPAETPLSEVERVFTWDYIHLIYVIEEHGKIVGTLTERRIFAASTQEYVPGEVKLLDIMVEGDI